MPPQGRKDRAGCNAFSGGPLAGVPKKQVAPVKARLSGKRRIVKAGEWGCSRRTRKERAVTGKTKTPRRALFDLPAPVVVVAAALPIGLRLPLALGLDRGGAFLRRP